MNRDPLNHADRVDALPFTGPALVGSVITGRQARLLANGAVLWAERPPAADLPQRPIWREDGTWTDGNSAHAELPPDKAYRVLRAPTFRVGDVVRTEADLAALPVGTALLDDAGVVAQSWIDANEEDPTGEHAVWALTAYAEGIDAEELWERVTHPLRVLHLPEEFA